ncbi:MAG: leucine-rich repeat domain-containing protein, partial [Clostridia bacterium]|nr:leucine-rich repeat domain-containing protein [Clostridia bacterium]
MKKFKGFISLLLALVMLSALTPSAALGASATSGTSSDGLSWKISNGTLTISGTGAMTDYGINDNSYPWWSQRKEITKVVVKDGVTHIGFGAFHYCRMTEVVLADSVTSIGAYAFWDCPNLESVDTGGAATIEELAFSECENLESVTLSKDLRSIGHAAFSQCKSLERIDVPAKTRVIDSSAFKDCTSLTTITLPLSITEIGRWAFYKRDSLSDVYYAGSKSDRKKISINADNNYNAALEDAEWHYNSSKAAQPEESDPTAQYYTVSFDACGVTTVASQSVEEYDLASEPNADMTR